jgi:hypothetical protein
MATSTVYSEKPVEVGAFESAEDAQAAVEHEALMVLVRRRWAPEQSVLA